MGNSKIFNKKNYIDRWYNRATFSEDEDDEENSGK